MTSLNQLIDSKQKEHKVMNKVNSILYFFNQHLWFQDIKKLNKALQRQRTAMQDELDENQNKTDEELKRLGFGFDECLQGKSIRVQ